MGQIVLKDVYRNSVGENGRPIRLENPIMVDSDKIVSIHCINGGLSVHLSDGSTFGSTKDRLGQILNKIAQHEGPDRLERIPLQFEDRTNVGREVYKHRYAMPASSF